MRPIHLLALALTVPIPTLARAADATASDCSRASGEVQTLICRSPVLMTLDRKMESVYASALAKARDAKKVLRAEQRGWIQGRDDCWKEQDTGVSACVKRSYDERIGELQARYELVPARGPFNYICDGEPANTLIAKFFETEPQTARLEREDKTIIAYQQPAASGAKYEGQNVMFWSKGNEAQVTWFGAQLKCKTGE